jgi:hypothetical protein
MHTKRFNWRLCGLVSSILAVLAFVAYAVCGCFFIAKESSFSSDWFILYGTTCIIDICFSAIVVFFILLTFILLIKKDEKKSFAAIMAAVMLYLVVSLNNSFYGIIATINTDITFNHLNWIFYLISILILSGILIMASVFGKIVYHSLTGVNKSISRSSVVLVWIAVITMAVISLLTSIITGTTQTTLEEEQEIYRISSILSLTNSVMTTMIYLTTAFVFTYHRSEELETVAEK